MSEPPWPIQQLSKRRRVAATCCLGDESLTKKKVVSRRVGTALYRAVKMNRPFGW